MEELRRKNEILLADISLKFKRFLYDEIDWTHRFVAILGGRGTGKTTMLLQYLAENYGEHILYASLDDFYFTQHSLLETAERFYLNGGRILLLDEVHKYPGWQGEIKNIYDYFRNLQVIFTGSSILKIYEGDTDLSRRVIKYELPPMSMREYMDLAFGIKTRPVKLEDILENPTEIARQLIGKIEIPLKHYNDFVRGGQYPFFKTAGKNYLPLLRQIALYTLEDDFKTVLNVDYATIVKLKKLLYIIASMPHFKPNISRLAVQTGLARETLLKFLHYLDKAQLLKLLYAENQGISLYRKPEKIYLQNPNLLFALHDNGEINPGTVRELFFLSQVSVKHRVYYARKTDFKVDGRYYFEIGGKSKSHKQIQGLPGAYLVKDDILFGTKKAIPLWLFGWLY